LVALLVVRWVDGRVALTVEGMEPWLVLMRVDWMAYLLVCELVEMMVV